MNCIRTAGWDDGVADLTQRLAQELSAGKRVLWLVSGGSNISASVAIMSKLNRPLTEKLTVGLIDERYGPVGHEHSNWKQLIDTGFDMQAATALPVLQEAQSLEETATAYNTQLAAALASSEVVIAQLGIGTDGHVAGILPNSSAAQENTALVTSFQGHDYQRITTTPAAFWHFDVAYAFAFGANKAEAVQSLVSKDLSVSIQPAQLLKDIPETYLYSDQLEDI